MLIHLRDDGEPYPGVKLDWFDLVVVGTTLTYNMVGAVANALNSVDDRARMHANWRRDRAEAFAEMIEEIERL